MNIYRHGDWLLTPERVAVHEPTHTAVVADLHLGYREARRRAGEAVPLIGLAAQLAPLHRALRRHAARRLVIAGDLVEKACTVELMDEFRSCLEDARIELAGIVPGNHDRGLGDFASNWPIVPTGFLVGGWRVLHGDGALSRERIVHGHVHPSIRRHGRRYPCYLLGCKRLVLPAYSLDAAGADVRGIDPRRRLQRLAIVADALVMVDDTATLRTNPT